MDTKSSSSSSSSSSQKTEQSEPPSSTERLTLRFVSQDGGDAFIKVASHMTFSKITKGYCDKKGLKPESLRFIFEGNRINPTDSPKSLCMEDNDVVDVMLEQTGGFN